MKKILFALLFTPLFATGQKLITLNDTSFSQGDVLRAYLHFEFNKPVLTEASKPELDSIVAFFLLHKNLVIEVGLHLDARYNPQYSTQLDKRRAKNIVDYMVSKGIDPARLVYKGYGDNLPIIPEATIKAMRSKEEQEKAHAVNRRTEFKIIKVN